MNILFLLPRYSENTNDSTLEKDLVKEFYKQGNKVTVVSILEEKTKDYIKKLEGINVCKIKCGKYYSKGTTKIDKGLTLLKLPYIFSHKIPKLIREEIDLIILSTPMMNNPYLMKKLKKYYNCKILLIVWDIFPQNAVDVEMISNKILINYFTKKYKKALEKADYISVMSIGNKNYLIDKFKIKKDKIFILKNWAEIKKKIEIDKKEIRNKYNFSEDEYIAIFGGNIGRLQKLENILFLAEKCLKNKKIKFLFIGSGSEKERLEKLAKENNLSNVTFINQVPREDYEKITASCDIGLVSLDERFTVPNFPSKTTDYFKLSLPIFASLDKCAAEDYGNFLQNKVKGGLYAEAGNTKELYNQFMKLYSNKNLRKELGNNGRKYYEEYLGVDKAYETIIKEVER